jgi:hypothetical protein
LELNIRTDKELCLKSPEQLFTSYLIDQKYGELGLKFTFLTKMSPNGDYCVCLKKSSATEGGASEILVCKLKGKDQK